MSNRHFIDVKVLDDGTATLQFKSFDNKITKTKVWLGRNGVTKEKREGDGKTPIGTFKLGVAFGIHDYLEKINIDYIQINDNLYWVDDVKSKYYNTLVDITKVEKDWNSAEHLIDYPEEYEYAIEIKTNPKRIPGMGSAIFLHCSCEKTTLGCVAINKEKMIELLKCVQENDLICIAEERK